MLAAFFDESGQGDFFCVAGYAFEPSAAVKFGKAMRALVRERWPFHMKDVVHKKKRYAGITDEYRDRIVRGAVAAVNKYATVGVITSCDLKEISPYLDGNHPGFRHAYSVLCHGSMVALGSWAIEQKRTDRIHYMFEKGGPNWQDANKLVGLATICPEVDGMYRFRGHAFEPKEASAGLHAADLLGWEWQKFIADNFLRGERRLRGSFAQLVAPGRRILVHHLTGPRLERFCRSGPFLRCGCGEVNHLEDLS